MKLKTLALLGLTAALSSVASAQTVIRIAGSSAFRAATHTAITNILQPGFTYGYAGTSFTGAGQAIFTGTTKTPTSTPVIIKTYWTGAVGGVKTLTDNVLLDKWLVNSTPQSTGGTPSAPANYDSLITADVALSDCFQNSTQFKAPTLVSRQVGVLPFQWVRNNGAPIGIDNMTPLLAANLLSGGILLSQFTGNVADNSTFVFCSGRDEDSGTRLVTFAESGFGIFSNPTQYRIDVNAGVVSDIVIWPTNTVLGTTYDPGHSGEASGGTLVTKLSTPGSNANPNNPGWVVSYAGINDAANVVQGTVATATAAITSGAVTGVTIGTGGTGYGAATTVTISGGGGTGAAGVPVISGGVITGVTITSGGSGYTTAPTVAFRSGAALKWNGYDYSAANVREGKYTFWSYEHLMYRSGYSAAAVADQLADRIKTVDASVSGILLSTMHVSRAVEGGDVTP